MEEKELADCLKEVFMLVNAEARLAGPATLERCMDSVCDGPGVGWLLATAQAWNLADAEEVRRSIGAFQEVLRSNAGRQELKKELAQRRRWIEGWRRQIVAHIRAWQTGRPSLGFQCQGSVDAGEVYSILTGNAKGEGDIDGEDGLHDHQS